MSDDVKTIPLRLEQDLFMQVAQYALEHNMSRTAVIRECLAAKFTVGKTNAATEVKEDGKSESKARKQKGKRASGGV